MRPLKPASLLLSLLLACLIAPFAIPAEPDTNPRPATGSLAVAGPDSGAPARRASAPAALDTNLTRLVGDWTGALRAGGAWLRVVAHLQAREGGFTGTLDSPDQMVTGLRMDTVLVQGDQFRFELRKLGAVYRGTIAPDAGTIQGVWSQGLQAMMLDFARLAPLEQRRPQTPRRPYPYVEEEVVVENAAAGVRLAGTFTKPHGSGPFPAALLIGGLGAQDRDEEVYEHRPFLVLADHLTRHGIAVLRLDDRGVGGSTGTLALATLDDFIGDASAAVRFLLARPDVDSRRVGLVGHSEGGLVAARVAAAIRDVAFVVLLASPGVPGDSLLVLQGEAILQVMGEPSEMIAWNRRLQRIMFDEVKSAPDSASLRQRLTKVITVALPLLPDSRRGQLNMENLTGQVDMMSTRWFRSYVAYDPAPALARLACPVLAVIGEKDLLVPPRENLPAIEKALAAAGHRDFRAVLLPGLNHLFQSGGTGSPAEYGTLQETFAPAALDTVTSWIEARVKPVAGSR